MADIEIKRGYVVLPDNRVKFGVRVINNGDSIISSVEVILDYSRSLFELEGSMVEALDTIPPSTSRTTVFILNPLGCVHKDEIGATVRYRDHKWEKHVHSMRPKEIHCVCPFLNEKVINRSEFLKFSSSGYSAERGVNFENIPSRTLIDFLIHTCKNRLYKVDSFSTENGTVLYLAGESLGEKACYLLTAVILDRQEFVQVLLKANSDKSFGLQGFLNEILENLLHLVQGVKAAREIGYIKNEQVINIIDSVVQHTNFSGGTEPSLVNVQDSDMQLTDFEFSDDENWKKEAEEKLRRQQEEEKLLKKEKEEQERLQRQQEEERKKKEKEALERKQLEEQERLHREEEKVRKMREEQERLHRQEEFRRQKEKEWENKKEEARKKKLLEVQERKLIEEEGRLKKEKEKLRRLQEETEETERKAKEEIERKYIEAARAVHAIKETTKSPTPQSPPPKKLPSLPPKKSKRIFGKVILIFSLLIGILFIGTLSFIISNEDPDDSLQETRSVQNLDTYTNSIGMEFVKIPAGEFMMGSPSDVEGRWDDEGPVHKVTIEEPFYLGRFEVTQEQWLEVMGSNPSYFTGDDLPVETVSWEDAQEFIEKLNEMEGTDKYRLPSEAEWEYACRAGTTTRYSFGNDESMLKNYCWYNGYSTWEEKETSKDILDEGKTHPVGQKKPNSWGLYDMHGNVWEWVQDTYHDNYNGAPADGSSWVSGDSSVRVERGGGWDAISRDCWSAFRLTYDSGEGAYNLGFRILKTL